MASKLARLTDLLTSLLGRRYLASFEELARDVSAYLDRDQAEDAGMRMFERDKDELRAFGIPIETIHTPEGEVAGYQLRTKDFYLPYLYVAAAEGQPGREPQKVRAYGYTGLPAPLSCVWSGVVLQQARGFVFAVHHRVQGLDESEGPRIQHFFLSWPPRGPRLPSPPKSPRL